MSPYKRLQQKFTKQKWVFPVKIFLIVAILPFFLFLLLNALFPLRNTITFSTVVYDSKGTLVNAYLTPDQKWRMKASLTEISPLLRKTIVAKEDKYFYRHPGINPGAVGRAIFNNLKHGKRTSGASTITMQVARAMEHHKSRTWTNKLVESFRALQLEWQYSKDEILQLYLNLVPYGGNIEGVKAASLIYFQKEPNHLSLAEITALSIIPNRPSSLLLGKNNSRVLLLRNQWLQRFASEKVFTSKEIEDALAEPLTATRNSLPHYLPHLAYKLKRNTPGPYIKTTVNLNTQLKVEKLTADYVRALRLKGIQNAAVIVVDNLTRQAIAYVGSAGFRDTADGGQVNGAAALRQPGSTLKPLLYGLCMDEGLLTPKTVLEDVPVSYGGYAPENYDRQFSGYITMERALELSLNIPAVKSLETLGKEKLIQSLAAADFHQVKKDAGKLGLSMALGGCGTTLEQLTGLFCAFANEGVYVPIRYTQDTVPLKSTRLLSTAASYLVTETLSKVGRPDFPLNWQATEHMPKIAWKTGTSYGRRDAWSIGYNKRFTVGVWVGNFSGTGVAELSGANTATPLLFKIFNTIDYKNDGEWFAPPEDCDFRKVCSETGLVPGPQCSNLILAPFIPLISSTQYCQHLQEIKVAADSSVSYCQNCAPESGYRKKLYRVHSPQMQEWLDSRNIFFQKLPPHNPACEKIFKGNGPAIVSPTNGAEYYISQENPEPLLLQARPTPDVTRVYWYINDQFYKSGLAGERIFFIPSPGGVKISCTDDKGRNRNIRIEVKYVRL